MDLIISTDPLNKHNYYTDDQIQELCGLLSFWLISGQQLSLKSRLIDNYAFYSGPMKGGTLTEEGVYSYPQDSDLYPLARFESEGEICFIFEYGIVGVYTKSDGETWVTRMD